MREILFRGKRVDNGELVEGNLIYSFEGVHISNNDFKPSNDQSPELIEVIPETVGQFTGLTDKNGVKIFEGDIIQWVKSDWKYLLKYELGAFCCYHIGLKNWDGNPLKWGLISRFSELGMEMEVIRNIHDNSELLK